MKIIFLIISLIVLVGCKTKKEESQSLETFRAAEYLRENDSKIRSTGIEILCHGPLISELFLSYIWVAEESADNRATILKRFSKESMGNDYYDWVKLHYLPFWLKSIKNFNNKEKQTRIKELKLAFPELIQ